MMKMTKLEKQWVNRPQKGQGNIARVQECLRQFEVSQQWRALELGCGTGAVAAFLASVYQLQVIGSDFDPEQIELARTLHPETAFLRYQVEDATNLSFPANTFDLIIVQNVFHHIPVWQQVVREAARVITRGGYFIWFDLAVPGLAKQLLAPLAKQAGLYTAAEVQQAFRRHDFTRLNYQPASSGSFMHQQYIFQKL